MRVFSLLIAAAALFAACDGTTTEQAGATTKSLSGKADASAEAVFLDFTFQASLVTDHCFNPRSWIDDQLLYTIGHLNGDRAVGRLDSLDVSNIRTVDEAGRCRVTYDARLPVAWAKKTDQPETYTFQLPLDMSHSGTDAFAESYGHDCVDRGAHDVTSGSMWYYFRPHRSGCSLADADIVTVEATVSDSPISTTGKFPEYHKVWEDDVLEIVAVFGKYEDGATTAADAGISAYNTFVREITSRLGAFGVETVPASVPTNPGIDVDDITFTADLGEGRSIRVVALLVDNVRTAGFEFDERYGALSTRADLIVYNGHAGLGSNIRALARKGEWTTGQYVIVFMNGCDTYAYVDSALADAHADVNDDNPDGTKYVDVVANALPSFFRSMPAATMALVDGLLAVDEPQTYEQMFLRVDASEVVLVTGEHDNVFTPGMLDGDTPDPASWAGLDEAGDVARDEALRFETPALEAGRYRFELAGSDDADLYVRIGLEPTTELYDCRPYRSNSDEVCEVDIATPSPVHVMVHGYADTSSFRLLGSRL